MEYNINNNITTTLQLNLANSDTQMTVKSGEGALFTDFPTLITLESVNSDLVVLKREIVKAVSKVGDVITIERAFEPCVQNDNVSTKSTTNVALDFNNGDRASNYLTKNIIEDLFGLKSEGIKADPLVNEDGIRIIDSEDADKNKIKTYEQLVAEICLSCSPALPVGIAGYLGGGNTSVSSTIVIDELDRFQFSDETLTSLLAVLSTARRKMGGVQSSEKGYFAGGSTVSGNSAEIDGIQFIDETAINPAATLAVARDYLAGVSSTEKGYIAGDLEIDGIQFSDETAINPAATLSVNRFGLSGMTASEKGYYAGGWALTNVIDGIQFSDETAINPAATLSQARSYSAGIQSAEKGYVCAGRTTTHVNTVDGIQFSDEAAINPAVTLSVARFGVAGTSGTDKGYIFGGKTTTLLTEIDGIQFSDETLVNPSAILETNKFEFTGVSYFN